MTNPFKKRSTGKIIRRLMLLLALPLVFSSCRYWSMYQFADQFCAYDENIHVAKMDGQIAIDFAYPVMQKKLLHHYLGVLPTSESTSPYRHRNIYILGNASDEKKRFKITVDFSEFEQDYLMNAAQLGPGLSQAFNPALVEIMLRSFCVDDYDVNLARIILDFKLGHIDSKLLPYITDIDRALGMAEKSLAPNGKRYHLIFLEAKGNVAGEVENRDVYLDLYWNQEQRVNHIVVSYYRYHYDVDMVSKRGRLTAVRSSAVN